MFTTIGWAVAHGSSSTVQDQAVETSCNTQQALETMTVRALRTGERGQKRQYNTDAAMTIQLDRHVWRRQDGPRIEAE